MSDDGVHHEPGLRQYERRTVIVHQPPGPSIKGILSDAYTDCFVVKKAESLDDDAQLGGEVVIPRNPGVFIQTVEAQ